MWVYVPSTQSASAPVSEGLISASDWRFQMLAQSATLSTKHSPPKSWHRAWKTKPWMKRLCGRISEPSTASRGVEQWISSLADIRVSPFPSLADALESAIRDTCGPTFDALLEKYSLRAASSKMLQDTFDWGPGGSVDVAG